MLTVAIKRSAQSVLHETSLPRDEANRIGEHIAQRLAQPGNYEKAAARYNAADEFEVGERAAREYVEMVLRQLPHLSDSCFHCRFLSFKVNSLPLPISSNKQSKKLNK